MVTAPCRGSLIFQRGLMLIVSVCERGVVLAEWIIGTDSRPLKPFFRLFFALTRQVSANTCACACARVQAKAKEKRNPLPPLGGGGRDLCNKITQRDQLSVICRSKAIGFFEF